MIVQANENPLRAYPNRLPFSPFVSCFPKTTADKQGKIAVVVSQG